MTADALEPQHRDGAYEMVIDDFGIDAFLMSRSTSRPGSEGKTEGTGIKAEDG